MDPPRPPRALAPNPSADGKAGSPPATGAELGGLGAGETTAGSSCVGEGRLPCSVRLGSLEQAVRLTRTTSAHAVLITMPNGRPRPTFRPDYTVGSRAVSVAGGMLGKAGVAEGAGVALNTGAPIGRIDLPEAFTRINAKAM